MISTSRLVSGPFKASDATDLDGYPSDPLVYQYEPSEPISLDRSRQIAQERASTTDFWAILEGEADDKPSQEGAKQRAEADTAGARMGMDESYTRMG
jgi:hypothetical protein